MKKEHVVKIICAWLVLLFVYAAASKLMIFHGFRNQLLNQPLPLWLSRLLVWMLPASELATAGLLSFQKTRKKGLYASLVLMTTFTGYIALVLSKVFGRIPCSCGGIFNQMSWGVHLAFNLVTLTVICLGILCSRNSMNKFSKSSGNFNQKSSLKKIYIQSRGNRKPEEKSRH